MHSVFENIGTVTQKLHCFLYTVGFPRDLPLLISQCDGSHSLMLIWILNSSKVVNFTW